ncbi:MAG: hypothetical protein EP338_13130 [Bacteroidetes bacterium]|nr:MAG: hypothetical protein EP338_13130 [Bacteroidota bacterium]
MSTTVNNVETNMNKEAEFNRFGLISVIILIIGCLGGVAVGLGAINYTATLIMVIVPTMATLSMLLAVAPMKWIISLGTVTAIIDVLLIVYFGFFT